MTSNHTLAHSSDIRIGVIPLHIFVASEWAVLFSKYGPESKARNGDPLHFLGDIIGRECNFLDLRGEFHYSIGETDKGFESYASLKQLPVSYDE